VQWLRLALCDRPISGKKVPSRPQTQSDSVSQLGQKRTSRPRNSTSVIPPRADIVDLSGQVRFVPKADQSATAHLSALLPAKQTSSGAASTSALGQRRTSGSCGVTKRRLSCVTDYSLDSRYLAPENGSKFDASRTRGRMPCRGSWSRWQLW
jgi:hypothetical protein